MASSEVIAERLGYVLSQNYWDNYAAVLFSFFVHVFLMVCICVCVCVHACMSHTYRYQKTIFSVCPLPPASKQLLHPLGHLPIPSPNQKFSNVLFFVHLLAFCERVSLYISGWSTTHHKTQADLKFSILLHQPPGCWEFCRHVPWCSANILQF